MNRELAGKLAPRQRARVVNGNFDFHAVPAGVYQFRVFDHSGRNAFQSMQLLTGSRDRVTIVFPSQDWSRWLPLTRISLRELGHHIPSKAQGAFHAATKAIDGGETENAIKYLERALQIDPEFSEAEVNLATQYVWVGREEEALDHFRMAFDRSPST